MMTVVTGTIASTASGGGFIVADSCAPSSASVSAIPSIQASAASDSGAATVSATGDKTADAAVDLTGSHKLSGAYTRACV